MDRAQSLSEAIEHLRNGRLEAAESELRTILQANPEDPDALHYYGILAFQAGHADHAVDMIKRSLAVAPEQAGALNNLGNILRHLDRGREAIDAYFGALAVDPHHGEAWCNVGVLLLKLGRLVEAVDALGKAVDVNPESAESWHNLGLCHTALGQPEQAADAFQNCARCANGLQWYDAGWHAYVLGNLGRTELAVTILEGVLERTPDNAVIGHMLAAIRGEDVPRASDGFVQRHFNSFSETFDTVLAGLDYKGPEIVAAKIAALRGDGPPFRNVIDLGCGTGLAGPLLREHCTRLTGIDLSSGMLAKAARREAFDALHEAEIGAFLGAAPEGEYDLAVSVDTLIYFGDLAAVFAGLHRALAPGGYLVATVEKRVDAETGHRINPTGRYSHSERYLRETAAAHGLTMTGIEEVKLRREARKPVMGYVFTLARN